MQEILNLNKMRNVNVLVILALFTTSSIFYSCTKDEFTNTTTALNTNEVAIDKIDFDYNNLSNHDKIKVIVGQAISNFLINNPAFNDKLFSKLISAENKTIELLYIKEKDYEFSNGKSLENLLLEFYADNQDKKNLISSINTLLPNLAIKIPEWTEAVLGNNDLDLAFAVYPCVVNYKRQNIYHKNGKMMSSKNSTNNYSSVISEYLPIQVEESERLIPVEKNTSITFWGDDFYEDNFPFLASCSDFNRQTYTIHSNESYDFVDKIALNEDLINVKLCGVSLSKNPSTVGSGCIIEYERDCRTEKNVIEGLKLSDNSVYNYLNNQPGGEDILALNFKFVVASMCGDLKSTQFCNPSTWTYIFLGTYSDFFETQTHYGNPTSDELGDVIFKDNNYYIKAFPKYYDIPINLSQKLIYSQINYLRLTPDSNWDGNEYGSAISFGIYEHDSQTTQQAYSKSIEITNTTKVSTKLTLEEIFEAGADFSNTVKRTTSYKYEIEGEKDVSLGDIVINYYDKNYNLPDGSFGINHTSGAVNIHFAFYY